MVSGGEIVVAVGKVASGAGALAKSSPWLIKNGKRVWRRVTKGLVEIPVFGAGGVGKSTAARIVAGSGADSAHNRYEESLWTEKISLAGDVPGHLYVVPGQVARIQRHWPEQYQRLASSNAMGLLNVVSFGYHSFAIHSPNQSRVWAPGMTMEDFEAAYTADRRQVELEILDELVGGLSAVTKKLWMVTIINKQDLWRDREAEVLSHYVDGLYAQKIGRIRDRLGSASFQHEFVPTSLTMSNLQTGDGQIVASTVEGYDMTARNNSLKAMSDKLALMVSK